MKLFTSLLLTALLTFLLLPALSPAGRILAQGPVTNTCVDGVGKWQIAGSMNGRVMFRTVQTEQYAYILGGRDQGQNLNTVEFAPILTDTLGVWQPTTTISPTRLHFTAVTTGSHLYILGGYDFGSGPLDTVEVASIEPDGSLGAWQPTTPLGTGRNAATALANGGFIYVLGGIDQNGEVDTVQRAAISLDGNLETWQQMSPMPTRRSFFGAVATGNFIYIAGGYNGNDYTPAVARVQIFPDGSLGSWETQASMVLPRAQFGLVATNGYLYAVGGSNYTGDMTGAYDLVERARINLDGSLGPWQIINAMTTPRRELGVLILGNYIYALSGTRSSHNQQPPTSLDSIERWDSTSAVPPTDYGLTINDGALFTNQVTVTLTVGQTPPWQDQIQVSNDGGFAGAAWQSYQTCKSWQITQYGNSIIPRTVYVRYKNAQGVVSPTFQDDIILDVTAPTGTVEVVEEVSGSAGISTDTERLTGASPLALPELVAGTALSRTVYLPLLLNQPNVTLRLAASDDVSGVAQMLISNSSSFAGATWEPYQVTRPWRIGEGASMVYVKFKDHAGNVSRVIQGRVNP